MKNLFILLFIYFLLISFGIVLSQFYNIYYPKIKIEKEFINDCNTQAKIQGLWLPDIKDLSNYSGRYICINIDETKDLKRLAEVCDHEVGHEIFARECENNFTKCLEVSE